MESGHAAPQAKEEHLQVPPLEICPVTPVEPTLLHRPETAHAPPTPRLSLPIFPDLSHQCSGHGTFSPATCSCHCEQGWEGVDCELPTCPGACSGHGRCVDGRCLCDEPYVGADCAYPACPQDCSGHGVCVRGVCQCHEDFISEDCSERRCPGDCSGHGFCDTGECYCELGFTGPDCSQGESGDSSSGPFSFLSRSLLHL